MISNQIPWDLKRTKTNKEENCFVFTLFSVFLLKYCNRLEKKSNSVNWGMKMIYWISFGVSSVIMVSNQIPWDLKRTKTNKEENCFVFTLFSVFLLKYCTY